MANIALSNGRALSEADLLNIVSAIEGEIQSAVFEAFERRKQAARVAKQKRASTSGKAPSPAKKYSKGVPPMNLSEQASLIATDVVLQKRGRGEDAAFRTEHARIMSELQKDPAGTKAKYAKQLAKSQPVRYQTAPPAKAAPPVFTPYGVRAAAIARKRCGANATSAEFNAQKQLALRELFDLAAKKQTVGAVANRFRDDPAMGEIVDMFGSVTDRAAKIAIKRCREGKPGTFKDHYDAALAELRQKAIDSANSSPLDDDE